MANIDAKALDAKKREVLGEEYDTYTKWKGREDVKKGEASVRKEANEILTEGELAVEYKKNSGEYEALNNKAIAIARRKLGIPEPVRETKA